MRALLLLAAGLCGCKSSFESELAGLRAEIVRLQGTVPPESPLWITDGPNAFDRHIEDFSPGVPDFIYNHVVRKLAQMKYEDIGKALQGSFPPDEAFKDPANLRGRFWKVHGTVANLEPLQVADRSLGVATVYSGVLFMEGRPILFHVVDKPEVAYIGQDVFEVNGIFVKILSYTARNGRKVDAPFFLGRRMGKYY